MWNGQAASELSALPASCRQPRVTEAHNCACMISRHRKISVFDRRWDGFMAGTIDPVGTSDKRIASGLDGNLRGLLKN